MCNCDEISELRIFPTHVIQRMLWEKIEEERDLLLEADEEW
jgi:hypothetical protein